MVRPFLSGDENRTTHGLETEEGRKVMQWCKITSRESVFWTSVHHIIHGAPIERGFSVMQWCKITSRESVFLGSTTEMVNGLAVRAPFSRLPWCNFTSRPYLSTESPILWEILRKYYLKLSDRRDGYRTRLAQSVERQTFMME